MTASAALPRAGVWVLAARVRTLPAAVVPVLVGTAAAARAGGARPGVAAAALVAAVLLQIGANFVNDVADFRRGADGPERLGPPRAVQAGLVSPAAMARAAAVAFAGAALLGLVLVAAGGWPVLALGVLAIAAAVGYTAGPFPLAYHGLGEPVVFAFFGPIAVCGTEWVQRGALSATGLAAAIPVGLLAAAILVVNNVRDVDGDRSAGKRTFAVRFGRNAARALYLGLVAAALAGPAMLVLGGLAPGTVLVAWGAIPLALAPSRAVVRRSDGPVLNGALAATARLHLVFGALLALGLLG